MTFRKLEIVVHSAKDLDDVKFFGTMNPYVRFWIAAGGVVSKIYKTDVAEKAGCYPVWNNSMEFELDPTKNDYVLFCEIQHDGTLFDRMIGEVEVPFTELLAGDGSRTRASYPVKIPYLGEVKGEIIISHKFSEPVVVSGKMGGSGTTTGKVSSVGGSSTTSKGSSRTGTKKKDGSMRTSSNKVSGKGTSGKEHTGNVCRPKETVEQKKKDGSMRINSNKVSGKVRSGKEHAGNMCRPKNKVERKKKDGVMKKIVKNVGVRVGTEAVLLAGTVGAVVASEFLLDGNEEQDEDKDKDVEEDEDEDEYGNEDEDEYENEDGNEDEDEDEYEDDDEDEYEDGDEDEDEYEDDDEDEYEDGDEDEDVDQDEDDYDDDY